MLPVKPYTVAVPANGSLQMQVTGRYLRVNACSNPITVAIDGIGTLGQIGAGQGFKLPASAQPFQRLMFSDASGAVNNVTFIVADSEFVDNTVLGTVSVVDGSKSQVIAGQVFGAALNIAPIAAKVPAAMLFCAADGSNKRVVVKSITFSCDTAGAVVRIGRADSSRAWVSQGKGFSKLITTLAPTPSGPGTVYTLNDTLALPLLNNYESFGVSAANVAQVRQFERPFVVTSGSGFGVDTNSAPSGLVCSFEWYEEVIL